MARMNEDLLSEIVVEIFEEVTVVKCDFLIYILNIMDKMESRKILNKKEFYKQKALNDGLELEKDIINRLYEEKLWTEEEEKVVQDKIKFIEKLKMGTSQIKLPSKRKEHRELIKLEEDRLRELEKERSSLVGLSAEKFADQRVNKDFFYEITYTDEDFKKPAFENLDYEELSKEMQILGAQQTFFEKFSEVNLSRAALSEFYASFLPYSEDPIAIFGKPLKDLTNYQMKLLSYGRTFLNIF